MPHGAVAAVTYHSSALKRFRRMHVYTPPGYETSTQRYPVFYLLHGAFDCDDSWWTVGRAGFILDNLIAAGKAKPMIVVMPAGHTGPFNFGPGAPRPAVDEFTADFKGDVVPYVEKNYRVLTGRQSRAIAGLSMGGAQTLDIAIPDLDQYAYVGVFSSGVFGIAGGGPMPAAGSELRGAKRQDPRRPDAQEGPEARLVRHGQGRLPDRDLARHRGHAEEARLRRRLQGDGRRPHLDQLARVPERVRPAPVSLICLACES